MKPTTPHDPLDDLIAAALHGDLTPEERTQFEARLARDPAAHAAYQEAQAMNDLLEKTHQSAQPNSNFEQRMVSGVRRKLQHEPHRETAWESIIVLWKVLKKIYGFRPHLSSWGALAIGLIIVGMIAGTALGPITSGIKQAKQSAALQEAHTRAVADYQAQVDAGVPNPVMKDARQFLSTTVPTEQAQPKGEFSTIDSRLAVAGSYGNRDQEDQMVSASRPLLSPSDRNGRAPAQQQRRLTTVDDTNPKSMLSVDKKWNEPMQSITPQGGTVRGSGFIPPSVDSKTSTPSAVDRPNMASATSYNSRYGDATVLTKSGEQGVVEEVRVEPLAPNSIDQLIAANKPASPVTTAPAAPDTSSAPPKPQAGNQQAAWNEEGQKPAATTAAPTVDDRKLIRNAQLELEVKSYQAAVDQITSLTKNAGGYVDTSNSQRGGNGKLQGTVVVKILPQNLDAFLLKLRDLGEVKNQSVSTDDVTKEYFDTQARLANSQKMETQLQELLKRENGKVSDLLAVERELGRVRGEIEQMQGQLKLYDFQVQYATVTMQMAEKDLKQAAAYLLQEQDDFSLFATDVETTFQTARKTADDFKAQVLVANLNHTSGSDVSAVLQVSVPPDQIEPFLAQIRVMGRVANFTRDTKRIARDGGDSAQPADQTLTEKDKVMVNVTIRSDDETRKQVAMTVVTKFVDDALDKAKTAVLAQTGASILSSSLNKAPAGQSTAQLSVRVPGKSYAALMDAFRALGRTASLSVQRNDDAGPGANGDDAPVIVSLALTDDDAPLQTTEMSVLGADVDNQSQQIKKDAAAAGVEVKASSFVQQPDGTEMAQMTFRLPMSKYAAFLATIQKLGKVESLSVQRNDRPDEARTDDGAPAEINLQLHNQRGIVAENGGLGATLHRTFGEGAEALFASVRVIGVLLAFILPWAITLGILAWIARRIYVWKKK